MAGFWDAVDDVSWVLDVLREVEMAEEAERPHGRRRRDLRGPTPVPTRPKKRCDLTPFYKRDLPFLGRKSKTLDDDGVNISVSFFYLLLYY